VTLAQLTRDLGVAARLGVASVRRRLKPDAGSTPAPDDDAWRRELETWVRRIPPGILSEHRFVDLPAQQPPWTSTGLSLQRDQAVTWIATGRVYLSRALDIWVDPSFQLWARIGESGPVFRGTRATHTFCAAHQGDLQLASYFPGEWNDARGTLGSGAQDYAKVSGGMCALVLVWQPGLEVARWLATHAASGPSNTPAPILAEIGRLAAPVGTPDGWAYLWYLGPGEIYRADKAPSGAPAICCETHGDVGILRRDTPMALEPGTRLLWHWRVDALPAWLREDSLPSHDYVSIAVEFDDGQDLTYYWSAELPVGTVYRCPLPTWKDKETHVVVRSGAAELGRWLEEERDVHADYACIIGGKARAIVRVWLIANSLFQRGRGRCTYAAIRLVGPHRSVDVL
jgi:hypothetical protein